MTKEKETDKGTPYKVIIYPKSDIPEIKKQLYKLQLSLPKFMEKFNISKIELQIEE